MEGVIGLSEIKYKRISLKVSGEALAGEAHRGLNFDIIHSVCDVVARCTKLGVQVGIMIGAGNFWRGGVSVTSAECRNGVHPFLSRG